MSELSTLIGDVKDYEMSAHSMFSRDEIERKKQRIREIESKTKT